MSTATLAPAAMRATMSSAPATSSPQRLRVDVISEDSGCTLPWMLDWRSPGANLFDDETSLPALDSIRERGEAVRNAADSADAAADDDESSNNEDDSNEADDQAPDREMNRSFKAVQRSLAEVEMRALEGKLRLLDTQRQLSALRCQRFIHVLESSLQANRSASAPATPFQAEDSDRPANAAGGAAAAEPRTSFRGDRSGREAGFLGEGHDYLSRSLPRSFSHSLSLSRSRSSPASLHNRLDSPRVRRAATTATPRSRRHHRAAAVAVGL